MTGMAWSAKKRKSKNGLLSAKAARSFIFRHSGPAFAGQAAGILGLFALLAVFAFKKSSNELLSTARRLTF
jgi:hypothetical protein